MKRIPLTQGFYAIVDDEDYEWATRWNWCVTGYNARCTRYAQRNISSTKTAIILVMHRELLGLKKGDRKCVDHINRNGLDNRRCNLRLCTGQQNRFNSIQRGGSSIYKGVCTISRPQKKQFLAQITHNNKNHFIGHFFSEVEAAHAYDQKAKEFFGKYAYLNFPEVSHESIGSRQ